MFVEKTPRPWDFCGCVGCPRCYDWADDLRGGVVDGFIKFVSEMLQGRPATEGETRQLQEGADRVHLFNKNKPSPLDEAAALYDEARAEEFLQRQLTAKVKARAKEATVAKVNRVVLDHIEIPVTAPKPKPLPLPEMAQSPMMDLYRVQLYRGMLPNGQVRDFASRDEFERQKYEMERAMTRQGWADYSFSRYKW